MKNKKLDALWSHIHWLGVLAAMGSFTATAARLGVSKAAVSHRICELESAAGVQLVVRTTRSVKLTEAGQHLVDSTTQAFASIEQGFVRVRERAEEPSGLIRLTAPVALGRQHLVPLLSKFLETYPLIRMELELSDRLSSLAHEGFDLAIRHIDTVPDTHVAWALCRADTVLAAAPSYLLRAGTPGVPGDLTNHNCLHYRRHTDKTSWSFEPERRGRGKAAVTVAVRGSFSANNSETLRKMAVDGSGIALLPDFSALDAFSSGALVRVLPRWKSVGAFGSRIYAIRPYSMQVPRAVRVLVTYLRASLAQGFALS